jgi:hypothetical protein
VTGARRIRPALQVGQDERKIELRLGPVGLRLGDARQFGLGPVELAQIAQDKAEIGARGIVRLVDRQDGLILLARLG